ncbi:MAG: PAS domain S-box protein [Candidatus Moranbacteria bacterium]|nr:PAS domain S-box protein [Candidatus Moranbacteria bacterium]
MKNSRTNHINYEVLVENSNDAFFVVSLKGKFVYVNQGALELTRYGKEELLGYKINDLVHPKDIGKVIRRLKRRLGNRKAPKRYRIKMIRKDGKVLDIELNVTKILWNNKPASLAVVRDVSENKTYEESLKERIKELNGLYGLEEQAFLMKNLDKILTNLTEKIIPESMKYPNKVVVRIKFDKKLYKNSNKIHPYYISAPLIVKNKKRGKLSVSYASNKLFIKVYEQNLIKCYARRLSKLIEKKETEEDLIQSKSRYKALVEDQVEAVCRWLPDTTLTFVNKGYCLFFDKKRKDLLGKRWLTSLVEKQNRKVIENMYKTPLKKPLQSLYQRRIKIKGRLIKRWEEWIDCPLFDKNNKVVEYQSVARDITDRIKIEQNLKEALEETKNVKKELEITLDALPQLICLLDQKGKIIRINKAAEKWFKNRAKNFKGVSIFEIFNSIYEDKENKFRKFWKNSWEKALKGNSVEADFEVGKNRKFFRFQIQPIKNHYKKKNRQDHFAITVISDITKRIKDRKKILDYFKYLGVLNRRVSILLGMSKVKNSKNRKAIYDLITNSAKSISQIHDCLLYDYDKTRNKFYLLSAYKQKDHKRLKAVKSLLHNSYDFLPKLIKNKKRIQLTNQEADELKDFKYHKKINYFLVLPLLNRNKLMGFMMLSFGRKKSLTTQELEFFEVFALHSSMMIMNLETS